MTRRSYAALELDDEVHGTHCPLEACPAHDDPTVRCVAPRRRPPPARRPLATDPRQRKEPDVTILDQFGPIVRQEFEAADECYHPGILEWLATLPEMSDQELQAEAEYRIYDSASVQRFRLNFEHVHVKATACYEESVRRLVAQGHGRFCSAPSIYGRAYNAVMRNNGYAEPPEVECNCELSEGDRESV